MGGGVLDGLPPTNGAFFLTLVLKELLLDVLLEFTENEQTTSRWLVHSEPSHPSINN